MKFHSASELTNWGAILAPDGTTVLAAQVACGPQNLSGRRLQQAQLSAPETSHMILLRPGDATALTNDGYISMDGVLYTVDYIIPVQEPRPGMWMEVYAHVERQPS